jgi:hypothetical protein
MQPALRYLDSSIRDNDSINEEEIERRDEEEENESNKEANTLEKGQARGRKSKNSMPI